MDDGLLLVLGVLLMVLAALLALRVTLTENLSQDQNEQAQSGQDE